MFLGNRYPGAMSDTESYVYRYSWDRDDLSSYPWPEHYVKQPEVLAYLRHVTDKYHLRADMRFETELSSARWDDSGQRWSLVLNRDRNVTARYLILGLGILSKTNYPDIPGIRDFQGEIHHTAKWPKDIELEGKDVGVLGTGSTGVQVITEISRQVKSLKSFQRHPQYSVPSGDGKVTPEYRAYVNDNYDAIWEKVRTSFTAFGIDESRTSYHDVTPEERQRIFQENWDKGNGFRFMFGTFSDISTDYEANEGACAFIRQKIDEIVKDPVKARKLKPWDLYARRPLCDGNARNGQRYFEQFNRPNVDVVDLRETPIVQIEAGGVRTSDGQLHELDVLILATGFDAVEGNFQRMAVHGRNGITLTDAWSDGPSSLFGVHVPEFPNMFMINGPKGAFTNNPPAIEAQVEWIAQIIGEAERGGTRLVEATHEGEQKWSQLCEKLAAKSLFWKAEDNWIFGANIPGKKRCLRFYFGGMSGYHEQLKSCAENDYVGFQPLAQKHATAVSS
ncbi:Baeyer-Villiger monooxygenase [Lecanosticta acicola]|uniref:Baeyer-Villiger monooxygenase n=1 Tax=Lecanosticta acicola TaxID=111012 RepID=A0AAI9E8P3_9PEZI|nr:Baeyer-Villiger monooxygenase [Lecanosticta acicola]